MADVKSQKTEIVELQEKLLLQMFASYANIKRDSVHPSTYFMWNNETGASVSYFLRVCHADMRYGSSIKPDEMITGIPFNDKLDLIYQRMLLSGPFRAVADHIELKTGGAKDKFSYAHITALDTFPANVLNNYCIATRLPIEHSHLLPMFEKMLEKGYDETFSLLLSFSRSGKIDGPRTMSLGKTNSNHMWFDPASSWANLLVGNFVNPSKPFKDNPLALIPANVIWGHDAEMARKLAQIGDDAEIAEIFGVGLNKAPPEPYVPGKQPGKVKPKLGAANAYQFYADALAAAQANHGQPLNWVNAGVHAPPDPLQPHQPGANPIPPVNAWPAWPAHAQPDQPEVEDIDHDDIEDFDGPDFDELDDDF